MTPLAELLRSIRRETDGFALTAPEDWLQGRSLFGGLQSAFALHAMRALLPEPIALRTLQTTFIAPVAAGIVRARARVLRTGANALHVEARLLDGKQTLALVVGVFGRPRASAIARMPAREHVAHDPRRVAMPYVPGFSPAFTQHFRARWIRGGLPFSGDPLPQTFIEVDLLDSGPASEAHVVAIADYVPPVALSMLDEPRPGSSLTWMLELLTDRFDHLSLDGWRVDASLIAARDGYTSQSTLIFAPDGSAVAQSQQSMVVFG